LRHPPLEEWAVLDVGGDVGALLVELDAVPATGELHARRAGNGARPSTPFHTGVHARSGAGKAVANIALFPALRAGAYEILDAGGTAVARIVVTGGQVTRASVP
jgi:hypothetical protein